MNKYLAFFIVPSLLSQIVLAGIPSDPLAAKVQELSIGNGDSPNTLDPQKCNDNSCSNILNQLFEALVRSNENGKVVPAQAESWSISPDGKKYTFVLRKNLKWSDGAEITAQDFVFGLQRLIDPKVASEQATLLEYVVNGKEIVEGKKPLSSLGVKSINKNMLEITLIKPTAYFLDALAVINTAPIQKKSFEKNGENGFTHAGKLVSNGTFKLIYSKVGDKVTIERNKYYWNNEKTYLEKVNYFSVSDMVSEYRMYESGQLDVTASLPTDQFKSIKLKHKSELRNAPFLAAYYYMYNTESPKLKNKKLREALNIAIDRYAITNSILGMGQQPLYDLIPYGLKNYTQNKTYWQDWTREKQLVEAKRLYKEAGYSDENPLEIQILYNTNDSHKKIAISVASMWKQVLGAKVEIANEEWKTMLDKKSSGQFEVMRLGGIANINDANDFLSTYKSTDPANTTKFKNLEYDKLLEVASNEIDPLKRRILLEKAGKILIDEVPSSSIYSYVYTYLVKPNVIGFKKNVMEKYTLSEVYIRNKSKALN